MSLLGALRDWFAAMFGPEALAADEALYEEHREAGLISDRPVEGYGNYPGMAGGI
jgi:hypothetical protein